MIFGKWAHERELLNEQDLNAGNSHVAACHRQAAPKHSFGPMLSSKQHGTNWIARCDFLLVFYTDLKSLKSADYNAQEHEH